MGDDELDSGTRKLVDDLLSKPPGPARDEILRRARAFEYHEYKTEHATPMIVLRNHLLGARFDDLAENVVEGKYDQGDEEAQKWAQANGEMPMTEPILNALSAIVDDVIDPVAGTPGLSQAMQALVQALGNTLGWVIAQNRHPHKIVDSVLEEIRIGVSGYAEEHHRSCGDDECDLDDVTSHIVAILSDLRNRVAPKAPPVPPRDAH